jgi:class 3 adenylate cyclase
VVAAHRTAKFSYDRWGDTVNTASRMESDGTASHIQVTDRTYKRLRGGYRA